MFFLASYTYFFTPASSSAGLSAASISLSVGLVSSRFSCTGREYCSLPSAESDTTLPSATANSLQPSAATASSPADASVTIFAGSRCGAAFSPSPNSSFLRRRDLKSISVKNSRTSGENGNAYVMSLSGTSSAQSVFMVASLYDISLDSLPASIRSASLPPISPRCSYTPRALPYLPSRSSARFSPTPGTPGMLSDVSPASALKSRICEGVSPMLSLSAAASMTCTSLMPRLVNSTVVESSMSWKLSRSPVRINVLMPWDLASVPMMSSASIPSCSTYFIPITSNICLTTGICTASSSGMPRRVAL